VARAVELARHGRTVVADALDPEHSLRGYSTHLNIEIDDRHVRLVATMIARRMAPALMLLLDGPQSPGLIVRPRHGRLELGGEFATGNQLIDAKTMACGMAMVADRAVIDRTFRSQLPPVLRIKLTPTP
jgi:hypothetical protein